MPFIIRNSAPQSSNLTANSIAAGSGTTNLQANSIELIIQSSSSNVIANCTVMAVGNSTANLVLKYNSLSLGNSTVNAVVNGSQLSMGTVWTVNATGEVVGNGVNYIYGAFGNSSANATVNSSLFALGNSTIQFRANSTTINVQSIKVQTNTFTVGSSSITANGGFTFLPNGLIMQWGKIAANTSTGNYTLPTPFPTNIFQITVATDAAGFYGYYILANTTTIYLRSSSSNSTLANVSFIALGS